MDKRKAKSLEVVLEGSEGEERGQTGGVRRGSGWQWRLLKLCRSLGTSEPCSTLPPLLFSGPSPSMWGKPPVVLAICFPWALTCGPLTLLWNISCCYSYVFGGSFMENKIIFCWAHDDISVTAKMEMNRQGVGGQGDDEAYDDNGDRGYDHEELQCQQSLSQIVIDTIMSLTALWSYGSAFWPLPC